MRFTNIFLYICARKVTYSGANIATIVDINKYLLLFALVFNNF